MPARRLPLALAASVGLIAVAFALGVRPRADRAWAADHARQAWAEIDGDRLVVHDLRAARWRSADDVDVRWEDRTYDLSRLRDAWYVVVPFGEWRGPAHTFVSFGFGDGAFLSVSVEARREAGEAYSPWRGLARGYELIYVVGDERDLVHARAAVWGDPTWVYPVAGEVSAFREMLVGMLARASRLRESPEHYDTLTNSCMSNVADHVDAVAPGRVPRGWRLLLPGYSDEVALEAGLLATEGPIEAARARFRVNEAARRHADDPSFSLRIREGR
ncbi:MAG: DUF4105 domain-containing protein [Myxococcota bacterium]